MYHEEKSDTSTTTPRRKRQAESVESAAPAALGKNTPDAAILCLDDISNTVEYGFYGLRETDNNSLSYRYALLDGLKDLLSSPFALEYIGKKHRATDCLTFVSHGSEAAVIEVHVNEERARLTRVCRCGAHNVCPNCAQVEGKRAAAEVQSIIDHLTPSHLPIMVTLTAHHSARMGLDYVNNKMFEALRRLTADGTYKRLLKRIGCQHTIRRFEFTWGKENGSHPHFHMLWFLDRRTLARLTVDERLAVRDEIYAIWRRVLEHVGLWCSRKHGVDVAVGSTATAQYISKLGALIKRSDASIASEVSRLDKKHARKDNRTIWQLLHDAHFNGDQQAGVLFVHYTKWAHRRVLVKYSNSIKSVLEAVKQQAAELTTEPAEQPAEEWHKLVKVLQPELITIRKMEGALGGVIRLSAVTKDAAIVRAEIERIKSEVAAYFQNKLAGRTDGRTAKRLRYRPVICELLPPAGNCDTVSSHIAALPTVAPDVPEAEARSPGGSAVKQARLPLNNATKLRYEKGE